MPPITNAPDQRFVVPTVVDRSDLPWYGHLTPTGRPPPSPPRPSPCFFEHTRAHIADPPMLSSSPRNGSGTAMNADLSLVEQPDSSARQARSLQNVPVRPPIAQSTPAFFCTFLRICQKISISQRLRAGCSLGTEGIGRNFREKEGSLFCSEVAVGEPTGRLRFVLSTCLRLRLTNRWPVPQEPYRQEPFLVDKNRIGGSAMTTAKDAPSSGLSVGIFSLPPLLSFRSSATVERKSSTKTGK